MSQKIENQIRKEVSIDAFDVILIKGERCKICMYFTMPYIVFSHHADPCMCLKLGLNCQIELFQYIYPSVILEVNCEKQHAGIFRR